MHKILVTGSAGFIGFHLCSLLLAEGFHVHGYDGMTDYYDIALKRHRHKLLFQSPTFSATEAMLEDQNTFNHISDAFHPDIIVHLAAQAGVRYSIEAPHTYLSSNIIGTFTVMEAARRLQVKHLLMASTSSVYGANKDMPFAEIDKADLQLSMYAATKKANESMAHVYAHLWNLPTTMFRFFTVYGPLGRPDLALFKFVEAIINDQPIDIYNHGDMYRDFTYVGDLVKAIRLLIDVVPQRPVSPADIEQGDSLSPVAPWRIVNIGNANKVRLLDFVDAIEICLGKKAIRNTIEIQKGDVTATLADNHLLWRLTGFKPQTNIHDGITQFIDWYRKYYNK